MQAAVTNSPTSWRTIANSRTTVGTGMMTPIDKKTIGKTSMKKRMEEIRVTTTLTKTGTRIMGMATTTRTCE